MRPRARLRPMLAAAALVAVAAVGLIGLCTAPRSAVAPPAAGVPPAAVPTPAVAATPLVVATPAVVVTPPAVVTPRAVATPAVPPAEPTRPAPTGLMEQRSRVHPDQRFYLYVPKSYDGRAEFRLLVVVHGVGRGAEEYTEEFTDFADDHRYIILAPVFPRPERYQRLGIGDDDSIRADLRLLALVDEIGGRYRVETASFDLFGFSGGGQFAHRFLYVHPERLRAVVVAAPGTVTLPTDRYRWPSGVADLRELANVGFDLARVRRVRPLLIVGEEDTDDENLNESDEANRFGKTRRERVRTLHRAWQDARIEHEYVEVDDLGHELDRGIVRRAQRFLAPSTRRPSQSG